MDWDFMATAPLPPKQLLHGCFLEAERSDRVAMGVDALRRALPETYYGHMLAVIEEIRITSGLLRELADWAHLDWSRAPLITSYLNIALPCISRSLRDITGFYEDSKVSREMRWRKMYHEMQKEADMPLLARFMMYNHFLKMLLYLLVRDKNNYDQGQLELLKVRILSLRKRRGIPEPAQVPVGTLIRQETGIVPMMPPDRNEIQWAEQVFAMPMVSRSEMKPSQTSQAFGPYLNGSRGLPECSRFMMRRPYHPAERSCPYCGVRHCDMGRARQHRI